MASRTPTAASLPADKLSALLSGAFRAALDGALARVRERTQAAVARRIKVGETWRVIAIGKAALTMFEGARTGLAEGGAVLAESLVVAPYGVTLPRASKGAHYMHAAHPLPDARSLLAADRALALAARAGNAGRGPHGNLLVLVSGGASALVSKPLGLSLPEKRALTDTLLRAGATIAEVNMVRRHLSGIKGGALLRAAGRARVVTLVVSDVLGDAPWDIGSGPTTFDPTTCAQAAAVLRRFAPDHSALSLVETLKPRATATDVELIASPGWFAHEVARALAAAGLAARVLAPSNADVFALAARYVQIARKLGSGTAVVRAAEPGVRVPLVHGRGGRCTQLCAVVAPMLPPGVALLAGATDGADGGSNTAGAVVHAGSFATRAEELSAAVVGFDAGPLHVRAGTALPRAPSGVNFADVHVLAASPGAPRTRARGRARRRARVTSS